MVTSPSDHVYVLENILRALTIQAELFQSRDAQVKVPKTPVPVNLLVLELELLTESVRAGPWTVLDRVLEYLKAYRDVIKSWIHGCETGKHQEAVNALARSFEMLEEELVVFVGGVACM
jgi:hypothetical protein